MRSASARPGIRSRSIVASAISCISSRTSWCARRRRCSPSGRAGRRRIRKSLAALIRAAFRAAEFIEQPDNRAEVARILAQPERIGVDADVIQRTLDGRLKISPDGTIRESSRYLLVGREGAARPDPVQAAWLYAQMVRWGQTASARRRCKTAHGGVQAGPLTTPRWACQRAADPGRSRRSGPSPARPSIRRHRRLSRVLRRRSSELRSAPTIKYWAPPIAAYCLGLCLSKRHEPESI